MNETLITTMALILFGCLTYAGYRLKYGALLVAALPYVLFLGAILILTSNPYVFAYSYDGADASKAANYELLKTLALNGLLLPAPLYSIAGTALALIKMRQECYARDIAALALSLISLVLLGIMLFAGVQVISAV